MDNVGELFPFDGNVSNAVGEANITVGYAAEATRPKHACCCDCYLGLGDSWTTQCKCSRFDFHNSNYQNYNISPLVHKFGNLL